jgi:hypothetical protein
MSDDLDRPVYVRERAERIRLQKQNKELRTKLRAAEAECERLNEVADAYARDAGA